MNPKRLKKLDSLMGSLLVRCFFFAAGGALPGNVHHLLLIRPGGIGDAVLLVPAIIALKQKFPQAGITVLAERRNAAAFSLCTQVDRVLRYDIPSELFAAVRGRYDLVIDSEQWHRLSAVVARLCRPKVLIGFGSNERRRIFSHAVAYSHDDYEVTSFLRLLEPLGIDGREVETPFLTVPAEAEQSSDTLLAPLEGRAFVTIFPGASIPERRWGADRYASVAESLNSLGYPVVVVGGGEERRQGDEIVAGVGGLNLAGRTSLAETAAVLARSSLLVSGDSGVLHLAVGLGVRSVSLFGPGRALKWAPRGGGHVVLNRNLPCSPCTTFGTTPPCPSGARCMGEIRVEEVLDGVLGLLSATNQV
jgi:ADP-heptose:LPS heptosyltransferase